MHFCKKGQIELEAILAIVLALGVLTMVLMQTSQQQEDIKSLEQNDKNKNQCNIISSIISLMNSNESRESIVIQAESGFEVTGNTVVVGNRNCNFVGQAQAAVLARGSIRVYEQSGVVLLENS